MRTLFSILSLGLVMGAAPVSSLDQQVPAYKHVFMIVEENKGYDEILDGKSAPFLAKLAKSYGVATHFYAEVHPSEGNYVAMISGSTYGIREDDAFYCKSGFIDKHCKYSSLPGYADHTISERHLGDQLEAQGLSWKGYYETLPTPGSLAITAGDPKIGTYASDWQLYASKHSGFMNFADVQKSPNRSSLIVGFDQLHNDLSDGNLPSFSLIVPNQCNEMHGLNPKDYSGDAASRVPADCDHSNVPGLIARGDANAAALVDAIQATAAWKSGDNVAIIITFDEGSSDVHEGCCGTDPASAANFGGGHIPTIVVTNHGPRGVVDPTPYSHYSLLRTLEDSFGLNGYLGHASDSDKGVVPMVNLFRTGPV